MNPEANETERILFLHHSPPPLLDVGPGACVRVCPSDPAGNNTTKTDHFLRWAAATAAPRRARCPIISSCPSGSVDCHNQLRLPLLPSSAASRATFDRYLCLLMTRHLCSPLRSYYYYHYYRFWPVLQLGHSTTTITRRDSSRGTARSSPFRA